MIEIRPNELKDIHSKKETPAGVYCWGYYEEEKFIPLYVGKSKKLHERLMQHYCRFKGGEYRLFDPDDLKAHYFGGLTLPAKPFTLYTPVSFKTMIDDLHLFKVKHKYMIDNFAFRYLVIEEESNRCSAERTLAKYIGSEWLISSVPYGGDDKIDTELKKLCA